MREEKVDRESLIVAKEAIDQELLRKDSPLNDDMLVEAHIRISEALGHESVWK